MIISPDTYRYTSDSNLNRPIYQFDKDREPLVWGMTYMAFINALPWVDSAVVLVGIPGSGKSTWASRQLDNRLYFDATNTTAKDRRVLIALCAVHPTIVHAVMFDASLKLCITRNENRTEDRRVPPEIVISMYASLQPPSTDEGFASVVKV